MRRCPVVTNFKYYNCTGLLVLHEKGGMTVRYWPTMTSRTVGSGHNWRLDIGNLTTDYMPGS